MVQNCPLYWAIVVLTRPFVAGFNPPGDDAIAEKLNLTVEISGFPVPTDLFDRAARLSLR